MKFWDFLSFFTDARSGARPRFRGGPNPAGVRGESVEQLIIIRGAERGRAGEALLRSIDAQREIEGENIIYYDIFLQKSLWISKIHWENFQK